MNAMTDLLYHKGIYAVYAYGKEAIGSQWLVRQSGSDDLARKKYPLLICCCLQ